MNGLLALVADFLEQAGNPARGSEVNELYRQRLSFLLEQDDGLEALLSSLELEPDDLPELSVDAWLWYLRWRSERHPPAGIDFLDALYQATEEPGVHARMVELAVRQPQVVERLGGSQNEGPAPRLEELPVPWLARRLLFSLDHGRGDSGVAVEASEIAVYLVQLGDPASRAVLRSLLSDPRALDAGLEPLQLLSPLLDREVLESFVDELRLER